jgi:hypothetical protein
MAVRVPFARLRDEAAVGEGAQGVPVEAVV